MKSKVICQLKYSGYTYLYSLATVSTHFYQHSFIIINKFDQFRITRNKKRISLKNKIMISKQTISYPNMMKFPSFQLIIFYSLAKDAQLDKYLTKTKTKETIVSFFPSSSFLFHHFSILRDTQLDRFAYLNKYK